MIISKQPAKINRIAQTVETPTVSRLKKSHPSSNVNTGVVDISGATRLTEPSCNATFSPTKPITFNTPHRMNHWYPQLKAGIDCRLATRQMISTISETSELTNTAVIGLGKSFSPNLITLCAIARPRAAPSGISNAHNRPARSHLTRAQSNERYAANDNRSTQIQPPVSRLAEESNGQRNCKYR